MITKLVNFYDTEDTLILKKRIKGDDIKDIEKKAHKILIDSSYSFNKYYDLYLQSFNIVR